MKSLECSNCGRVVDNIGDSTKTVLCSYCVIMKVGLPEEKKTRRKSGRPAGWHFMKEFVDKDGNVFHRGKEQPELKGTLEPTIVIKTKVKTVKKRRTQQEILLDRAKEKKAALKKAAKKQQDFLNHNFGD
tara:strand:+ start:63 stop:452 length:390 start_codon:yes stop_codon:yes gene_type:complete